MFSLNLSIGVRHSVVVTLMRLSRLQIMVMCCYLMILVDIMVVLVIASVIVSVMIPAKMIMTIPCVQNFDLDEVEN